MSTLASDDFNRADSSSLGANWSSVGTQAGWHITSNVAVPDQIGSVDSWNMYNGTNFPDDQWVQADVTVSGAGGGGQGVGVALRMTNTSLWNAYRIVVDHAATANIELSKFVNGTYTSLQEENVSFSDGATLYAEVQGTVQIMRIAGATQPSHTDSSVSSGNPGVSLSSAVSSASLDNWSAGNFASGPPPPYTPGVQNLDVRRMI